MVSMCVDLILVRRCRREDGTVGHYQILGDSFGLLDIEVRAVDSREAPYGLVVLGGCSVVALAFGWRLRMTTVH